MRMVLNLVLVLMIAFTALAVSWRHRVNQDEAARVMATREAVRRIESEVKYRAVTGLAELNEYRWPAVIEPDWFIAAPPRNMTMPSDRPWIEVDVTADATRLHPKLRVSTGRNIPAFWYNPANGVVRARVGPMLSDRRALDIYNSINGVTLTSLFETGREMPESQIVEVPRGPLEMDRADPVINVYRNGRMISDEH